MLNKTLAFVTLTGYDQLRAELANVLLAFIRVLLLTSLSNHMVGSETISLSFHSL